MSESAFEWKSLLEITPPEGCSLRAALLTTYDQPDERLLVEHLFPSILALNREADSEGVDRQYFLLELDQRLKQLHDRVVVVSSTTRDEETDNERTESSSYRWIWHSVRHLTVGYNRKAVQHAKLWLLHWAPSEEGSEYFEILVSSANLTLAAFKGQIQAAWRIRLPVQTSGSQQRYRSWGLLPAFLKELAASTGDLRWPSYYLELFRRTTCPDGVSFVASVPGTHSRYTQRKTPWGVAGLKRVMPSGVTSMSTSILSPFVGSWNQTALATWCDMFGTTPTRLSLIWIGKDHPWHCRWILPNSTLRTFTKKGVSLLRLCLDRKYADPDDKDRFHEEHQAGNDSRWSHAKVYMFRRGRSRRLLVTSANFSQAAWGTLTRDGQLTIENFELGVCIAGGTWPFEYLALFDDPDDAATVQVPSARRSAAILWARAVWNGRIVVVDCRCDNDCELVGRIKAHGKKDLHIGKWQRRNKDRSFSSKTPWKDGRHPPTNVILACEDQTLTVPVFDESPIAERDLTVPLEIDPESIQQMRDALLFEQYGGRVAAESNDQPDNNSSSNDLSADFDEPISNTDAATGEDYSIPAFVAARRHFEVVDNWAGRVRRLAEGHLTPFDRHVLRRDGEMLVEAFARQGATLAAKETEIRIKHFPEA